MIIISLLGCSWYEHKMLPMVFLPEKEFNNKKQEFDFVKSKPNKTTMNLTKKNSNKHHTIARTS